MSDRDYEGIAERLATIEEELRDLAYERLRASGARSRQRCRRSRRTRRTSGEPGAPGHRQGDQRAANDRRLDAADERIVPLLRWVRTRYRRDENAARSSSEKSWGCSQAAKWPPRSTSLKWMRLGYAFSAQLRGA